MIQDVRRLDIVKYVKRMYDPTRDRFLDIYKYRDSGDNMITGLIKIL